MKNVDDIAHKISLYVLEEAVPPCTTGDVRVLEFGRNIDEPLRPSRSKRADVSAITVTGIVQVCYDGLWGSVCESGWNEFGASVACQQLLGEGEPFHDGCVKSQSNSSLSFLFIYQVQRVVSPSVCFE